jgi:hypothetical protein
MIIGHNQKVRKTLSPKNSGEEGLDKFRYLYLTATTFNQKENQHKK